MESSRQRLAAAARRIGAPQWCSQLTDTHTSNVSAGGEGAGDGGDGDGGGNGGGGGHRGFLFELFEIRQAGSTYSQALASLLGEAREAFAGGGVPIDRACRTTVVVRQYTYLA